jgi:hypothetical protein
MSAVATAPVIIGTFPVGKRVGRRVGRIIIIGSQPRKEGLQVSVSGGGDMGARFESKGCRCRGGNEGRRAMEFHGVGDEGVRCATRSAWY